MTASTGRWSRRQRIGRGVRAAGCGGGQRPPGPDGARSAGRRQLDGDRRGRSARGAAVRSCDLASRGRRRKRALAGWWVSSHCSIAAVQCRLDFAAGVVVIVVGFRFVSNRLLFGRWRTCEYRNLSVHPMTASPCRCRAPGVARNFNDDAARWSTPDHSRCHAGVSGRSTRQAATRSKSAAVRWGSSPLGQRA